MARSLPKVWSMKPPDRAAEKVSQENFASDRRALTCFVEKIRSCDPDMPGPSAYHRARIRAPCQSVGHAEAFAPGRTDDRARAGGAARRCRGVALRDPEDLRRDDPAAAARQAPHLDLRRG